MLLPFNILNSAKNKRIVVETKDGANYKGTLLAYDNFMNLSISPVTYCSRSRDSFWRANECYIRGTNIKCMMLPDEALEEAFDREARVEEWRRGNNLRRPQPCRDRAEFEPRYQPHQRLPTDDGP